MSNTKLAIVLLTLVGVSNYSRRDLAVDGIPTVIKKGETIAVTEAVADDLTDEDKVTTTGDEDMGFESQAWFVVADEGTEVTHDFTPFEKGAAAAENGGQGTITHDLSQLPEEVPIAQAIRDGRIPVKTSARVAQRAAKKSA